MVEGGDRVDEVYFDVVVDGRCRCFCDVEWWKARGESELERLRDLASALPPQHVESEIDFLH